MKVLTLYEVYNLEKKLSEKLKVKKISKIYKYFADDLIFIIDDSIKERIGDATSNYYKKHTN